mmetsp:Transcript_22712/g.40867  ORF Transcript_22712/g.40867 Transcript_22712/m.40867 type:complete len:185 (+) Transcript_22712:27-581(+)
MTDPSCEVCFKQLSSKSALKLHLYTHSETKPFACEQCGKSFCQKAKYIAHMNAHKGLKPFLCKVCSFSFTSADRLKTHLMLHSGERPWTCEICLNSFRRKYELNRHVQIHDNSKKLELLKFICKLCGKRSATPADKKKHIVTHSDMKGVSCPICDKLFKEKYTLSNHLILVHNGQPNENKILNY